MELPIPDLLRFGQAAVCAALKECATNADLRHILALDATCGNGHDTLFLATTLKSLAPDKPHTLIALDVQKQALENTRLLLERNGLHTRARLLHASHEDLETILSDAEEMTGNAPLAAAMYNLGYLPGSDKRVITRWPSTLASLNAAANRLAAGGLISVHAYGGHAGGREELEALDVWCEQLEPSDWTVARYSMHNKTFKPEVLFLLQKKRVRA